MRARRKRRRFHGREELDGFSHHSNRNSRRLFRRRLSIQSGFRFGTVRGQLRVAVVPNQPLNSALRLALICFLPSSSTAEKRPPLHLKAFFCASVRSHPSFSLPGSFSLPNKATRSFFFCGESILISFYGNNISSVPLTGIGVVSSSIVSCRFCWSACMLFPPETRQRSFRNDRS